MRARRLALRGAAAGGGAGLIAAIVGFAAGRGDEPGLVAVGILGALVIVGVAIGYIALARPSETLHDVSRAADRVAAGELGSRATLRSRATEDLTDAFNTMSDRIQELVLATGAEQARLEAVFDASTDAMIALSRDTIVRFLNAAASRLLAVGNERAIGRPFIESARDYELDALVRRAVAKPGTGEAAVITFGPRRTALRAVAVPILGGGDWAVLLILNDLTDVQRIDQVRRDFLTNVSHELRTPLASILAMVETLEGGAIDEREDALEFLQRIHQQVDRLTTLVTELLDLSRIESGAIELRPELIDLAQLVDEAVSLMRTRTESERITIESPSQPGPAVEGDRTSLLRVVSNLLDNAVKFSPTGGTVHVSVDDEGDLVALRVRDEGEGIPEADLPRVFERFYKGDQSRSQGGVGLGLAIVKHVVRVHGGTAEAVSSRGQGATFVIHLPKKFVGVTRGKAGAPR